MIFFNSMVAKLDCKRLPRSPKLPQRAFGVFG